MIIQYSDTNENRIEWQHRRGGEWKTAELDELIEAYEREKTGKWINYKDEHRCSCCGEAITGDWFYEDDAYSYCPNCGARMVEE